MPRCYLIDNGSLRPAATLNLRRLATGLSERSGLEVLPVSLLHSNKADFAELDNKPAEIFEPRFEADLIAGERDFLVVPLFFGPTRAITDFLQVRALQQRKNHPDFRLRIAPFLYSGEEASDRPLVRILAEQVRETIRKRQLRGAPVVLVDHGSPVEAVTTVRNALASEVARELGGEAKSVVPASMERREGEQYAFNEPLLERQLDTAGYNRGDVIISMLFLSPGRHGGPEGDIAQICGEAEKRNPGLRTHMTPLVGEHPGMVEILEARLEAGLGSDAHI